MIRRAVGAIVTQNEKYLLIHKVKLMDRQSGPMEIPGNWDFPKGGIKSLDEETKAAVLRELWEETGSKQYEILHEFDEKLLLEFPPNLGLPYSRQETSMFLVQYTGNGTDLCPQDEEIDRLAFFTAQEVLQVLPFKESQAFFRQYLNDYLNQKNFDHSRGPRKGV